MARSVWKKKRDLAWGRDRTLVDILFRLVVADLMGLSLQKNARAGKGCLGLLAVVDVVLIVGDRAGFRDIPRCSALRMLWVARIWRRLVAKGNREEGGKGGVHDGGQDWGPDV
jgi:hypothetical protein